MKIGKFLLEKKYQFKGKSNRTPPYSYRQFCKVLASITDLKSMTMAQHFEANNKNVKKVLIRHDIDHDPWTAEKMAVIESENNLHATYFVLHTAFYFKNKFKQTMRICKNIQSMGHEIGLHNDLITNYFKNNLDPKENLTNLLTLFKNEGINILGSAAHGSKFIQNLNHKLDKSLEIPHANYLVFSEIIDEIQREFPNKKMQSHLKINGKNLSLPCINMSDYGLMYESYFIPYDNYVSDAGRKFWSTGDDPITTVKKMGNSETLQCLFHPIWWKYYLS
jgi:hypothetical protein